MSVPVQVARRFLEAALVLPLLVAVGCAENEPETAVEAVGGGEGRVELVTGEPFEATGVVDDVLGTRAFLLFDTLVITPQPTTVAENDRVRVTGEVEAAGDVARDLRRTLSDDVLEVLAQKELVVVASDVVVVDDDAR